jgi:hypothetical protein
MDFSIHGGFSSVGACIFFIRYELFVIPSCIVHVRYNDPNVMLVNSFPKGLGRSCVRPSSVAIILANT